MWIFSTSPDSSYHAIDGIAQPIVRDGNALHQSVPPERWCVTRRDLQQLRLAVQKAILEGLIKPSNWDPFDVHDNKIGPCIHTVNEQFIKPITATAGNTSWALMLHPDGLKCDVFISHCWQEGIYEFIDRVLNSWPRDSMHAYCCMLSNPQNLNIGDLIRDPEESPFAKALRAANFVLVVPNHKVSIYSRIWCVYEAFLAYHWNKIIYTASAPPKDLSWWLLLQLLIFVSVALLFQSAFQACCFQAVADFCHDLPIDFALFVLGVTYVVANVTVYSDSIRRVSNCMGPAFMGPVIVWAVNIALGRINAGECKFVVFMNPLTICFWGIYLVSLIATFEKDRIRDAEAEYSHLQLRTGWTGNLADAGSSVPEDKESILRKIQECREEEAVNEAVEVLIDAGMSTPSLRLAAARVGHVHGAGEWRVSTVFMMVFMWIAHPLSHILLDNSCGGALWWVPHIKVGQGLAWIAIFKISHRDERGFVSRLAMRFAVAPYALIWASWVALHLQMRSLERANCIPDGIGMCLLGPVLLALSFTGIAGVVSVPIIGPKLVRCVF